METIDGDNPVEGDLALSAGDLVWTSDLATEVAQRLRVRFRFFQGEWFLDRREGTPWYQSILVKNPDSQTVQAVFTKVVRETVGVKAVDSLSFSLDHAARELSLEFVARLQDGSTFVSKDFGPYILEF